MPKVSLPSLTSKDIQPDLRAYLGRVREAFEKLDFLTLDDINALIANGTIIGGRGGGGGGGGDDDDSRRPPCGDTQFPTAPTGFEAEGAFTNIILSWDAAPYCGHAFTEIHATDTDDIGLAVLIGQTSGTVFADAVKEGTTRYYWIRHVNVNGVKGPFHDTKGLMAQTSQDPEYLLKLLIGQITDSQLDQYLRSRVDAIKALEYRYSVKVDSDGYISGFGFAVEPEERASSTLVNAISATATTITLADASEFPIPGDDDSYIIRLRGTTTPPSEIVRVTAINGNTLTVVRAQNDTEALAWPAGSLAIILTTISQFGIRADRFYVGAKVKVDGEDERKDIIPFVINTDPNLKIDGEPVPVGVFIDGAWIKTASIKRAAIGLAVIDDARIASIRANKLVSSEIEVGVEIRSSSWNEGNYGWKIDGLGNASFENATVRGTVRATDGWFYGDLYGGAATSYTSGIGFFSGKKIDKSYGWRVGSPTGARIQWTGSAIEIRNSQNVVTFSSGSINWQYLFTLPNNPFKNFAFLDKLKAENINNYIDAVAISRAYIADAAIDSLKIAGNAVTVPLFGRGESSVQLRNGQQILVLTFFPTFPIDPAGVLILVQIKAREINESATNVVVEVYRNGVLVAGQITSTPKGFGTSHAFSFYDHYPGAGAHTYQLYLRNDWPTGAWVPEYYSMTLMAAMR